MALQFARGYCWPRATVDRAAATLCTFASPLPSPAPGQNPPSCPAPAPLRPLAVVHHPKSPSAPSTACCKASSSLLPAPPHLSPCRRSSVGRPLRKGPPPCKRSSRQPESRVIRRSSRMHSPDARTAVALLLCPGLGAAHPASRRLFHTSRRGLVITTAPHARHEPQWRPWFRPLPPAVMSTHTALRSAHAAPAIPKRRKKKRSPNEIAVKPASPEVISNLLASFSAISLPPDEPEHVYPNLTPRTPPRALRPQDSYTNQRIAHLHPNPRRDPSLDIPELRNPYESQVDFSLPEEDEEDGDVAEPPVVRTSRPPTARRKASWMSRTSFSSQRAERPGSSLSQRSPQEDDTLMTRLASLTSLTRERTSGLSSPVVMSGRPSFDNRRNESSRTGSMTAMTLSSGKSGSDVRSEFSRPPGTSDSRQSDTKGKARARAISPVPELSNNSSRPPSSVHRLPSALVSQSRANVERPPAEAIGDDTGFVIFHPPKASPTSPIFTQHSRVSQDGPPSIPSRTASLPRVKSRKSSRSPKKSRSKEQSDHSPAQKTSPFNTEVKTETRSRSRPSTAETVFLDPGLDEDAQKAKRESQKVIVDLDEDNEVTRRIKELRAANEKRRQDYVERTPAGSPTANSPSLTTPQHSKARQNALKINFSTLGDDNEDLPPSTIGRNGAMLGLPAPESLALPETDLQQSLLNRPRQSHDSPEGSPALSRSNSQSKRWNVSDFVKGSPSPEKSHRRVNSKEGPSPSQYTPVINERRDSEELIREQVDMFLASPKLSRKIPALEDFERQIAFSDVGDPQGHVVFCCLGMGLTRYVTAYYEELAHSLGLRLITPDRPGVGDSTAYKDNLKTPLNWPDDIRAICRYLGIEEFSILAHSAGAIYALATALRMPQRICGNIHLLAPWIPPSQMTRIGIASATNSPTALPRSQRFLRLLPTSFLKLSNSSLLSSRNAVGAKSPNAKSRKSNDTRGDSSFTSPRPSMGGSGSGRHNSEHTTSFSLFSSARASGRTSFERQQHLSPLDDIVEVPHDHNMTSAVMDASILSPPLKFSSAQDRATHQQLYDQALTPAVWDLATRKANPAVDLLVCLERHHKIGFRYADIKQPVVIHHGSKDNRVPLENIKWLAKTMQHAEVRVLDGEGHGLMASAGVIAAVLIEMGKDLENRNAETAREPLMED
ncbi:hypothetical protein FH972_022268 [Carpinus fangiana]|uniref:AB hydrolase-1 domain-containing protein n=1 Tax=Carpinus fangiana TaxID=176857 RepID=A0A5N6KRS1_9ROSI|nr:hypothetical protein FH972_022268 [Carpinus fangiana]